MDVKLETYTIQHLLINKKKKYTNRKLYTTIIKNAFTTDNESHEKKKTTNKQNKQTKLLAATIQHSEIYSFALNLVLKSDHIVALT